MGSKLPACGRNSNKSLKQINTTKSTYPQYTYITYEYKYWFGAFPGVSRNQSVSWLSYGFQTEVDASWERSRSKIQRYSERALRVRVLAKDPYHWCIEISSKWMTVLKQPLPSSACWALPQHQLSTNHPKKTLTAQALTRNICELETFSNWSHQTTLSLFYNAYSNSNKKNLP